MRKLVIFITGVVLLIRLPLYAENQAVVAGTSVFKTAGDLPSCEYDAEKMAWVLYEQGLVGEKIEPLTGPNRKSMIEYKIKRAAHAAEDGDTLIIYYSGHGNKNKGMVAWDGYISDKEMSEWISESKCSRVLLINDSCFSEKFKLDVPGKEVCQINSSSAPMVSYVSALEESSWHSRRNSVFTKYLLLALRPANSDANGDGILTAQEVVDYIKQGILKEEAPGWREEEDLNNYPTLEAAKEAMDEAYDKFYEAKEKDDKALMIQYKQEYWQARREYSRKADRVEMRWQSPTITGDPDFAVIEQKKMVIEGVVENKKTGDPILEAKVGVTGTELAVYTDKDGKFTLKIPYKLVNSRYFNVYAKKGEADAAKELEWKTYRFPFKTVFRLELPAEKEPGGKLSDSRIKAVLYKTASELGWDKRDDYELNYLAPTKFFSGHSLQLGGSLGRVGVHYISFVQETDKSSENFAKENCKSQSREGYETKIIKVQGYDACYFFRRSGSSLGEVHIYLTIKKYRIFFDSLDPYRLRTDPEVAVNALVKNFIESLR